MSDTWMKRGSNQVSEQYLNENVSPFQKRKKSYTFFFCIFFLGGRWFSKVLLNIWGWYVKILFHSSIAHLLGLTLSSFKYRSPVFLRMIRTYFHSSIAQLEKPCPTIFKVPQPNWHFLLSNLILKCQIRWTLHKVLW